MKINFWIIDFNSLLKSRDVIERFLENASYFLFEVWFRINIIIIIIIIIVIIINVITNLLLIILWFFFNNK